MPVFIMEPPKIVITKNQESMVTTREKPTVTYELAGARLVKISNPAQIIRYGGNFSQISNQQYYITYLDYISESNTYSESEFLLPVVRTKGRSCRGAGLLCQSYLIHQSLW